MLLPGSFFLSSSPEDRSAVAGVGHKTKAHSETSRVGTLNPAPIPMAMFVRLTKPAIVIRICTGIKQPGNDYSTGLLGSPGQLSGSCFRSYLRLSVEARSWLDYAFLVGARI